MVVYHIETYYREFMMLIAMLKVFYDTGITAIHKSNRDEIVNDMDDYYQCIIEALDCAAPIMYDNQNLYKKYGCDEDSDYIYAYSCREMQEYYKIAHKLHRIEGCMSKENPYIEKIEREIEGIRNFFSYCFDYNVGNKRKGARLEILLFCGFDSHIPIALWLVRTMRLFKDEMPELYLKYRGGKLIAVR